MSERYLYSVGRLGKFFLFCKFTGAAFEEDVVGNDDRGSAVLPQDGEDVLEEVELFVTRAAFPIFSPISVVEVEIADFQVPNPPC